MAALDTRSIVITLKLDSGQNKADENPTDTEGAKAKTDNNKTSKAVAIFAATQVARIVATEVVDMADYIWNRELQLTDDYVGQRNKRIALTYINRGISAIATTGSMAAAGASVGGGWGAVVGIALGIGSTLVNWGSSIVKGMDQQHIQLRQLDASLDFTRSRAGWSLQAASIGEDL